MFLPVNAKAGMLGCATAGASYTCGSFLSLILLEDMTLCFFPLSKELGHGECKDLVKFEK